MCRLFLGSSLLHARPDQPADLAHLAVELIEANAKLLADDLLGLDHQGDVLGDGENFLLDLRTGGQLYHLIELFVVAVLHDENAVRNAVPVLVVDEQVEPAVSRRIKREAINVAIAVDVLEGDVRLLVAVKVQQDLIVTAADHQLAQIAIGLHRQPHLFQITHH